MTAARREIEPNRRVVAPAADPITLARETAAKRAGLAPAAPAPEPVQALPVQPSDDWGPV